MVCILPGAGVSHLSFLLMLSENIYILFYMNNKIILSSLLIVSAGLTCAAPARKGNSKTKKTTKVEKKEEVVSIDKNKENNTFDIALKVYERASMPELTEAARNKVYERAAELFQKFAHDYENSEKRSQALMIVATCRQKLGNEQEMFKALETLADLPKQKTVNKPDENIALAAYLLGVNHLKNAVGGEADASLTKALHYFDTVAQYSEKAELVYDAKYRMAAINVEILKTKTAKGENAEQEQKEADALYSALTNEPAKSQVPAKKVRDAYFYYAQFLSDVGAPDNAMKQYENFLSMKDAPVDKSEDKCHVAYKQIARIALKNGDKTKAVQNYKECKNAGAKYDGAALDCEIIMALYQADGAAEILKMYSGSYAELSFLNAIKDAARSAQCARVLGYVKLVNGADSDPEIAAPFFKHAETKFLEVGAGDKSMAAEAGFYYIVCKQKTRNRKTAGDNADDNSNFEGVLEEYITRYEHEPKAAKYINMVRATRADLLLKTDTKRAVEQYEKIDINLLPEEQMKLDVVYKKAWIYYYQWKSSEDKSAVSSPEPALTAFLKVAESSPSVDPGRKATILCMLGIYYSSCENYAKALEEFEKVITNHKNSTSYSASLQGAAYACMAMKNKEANKKTAKGYEAKARTYFSDLVSYVEKIESGQNDNDNAVGADISKYATADAYYQLGCLYCFEDQELAMKYFNQAAKDCDDYVPHVELGLVQCQYLLITSGKAVASTKDNTVEPKIKLITDLTKLKKDYVAQYRTLTGAASSNEKKASQPVILIDAAGWCYDEAKKLTKNTDKSVPLPDVNYYELSIEFYRDAIVTNVEQGNPQIVANAKAADLFNLAGACLEAGKAEYIELGLQAIDRYMELQKDPYDRANAMLLKAKILNDKGQYADAAKLCDEALNLGVNGPIVSKLRLVSGDAAYLSKDYEKASKLYGLVANFDRSEDLNREALYKAYCAMKKDPNRVAESENYLQRLEEKLKVLGITADTPLLGLPPSAARHVSHKN